MPTPVLVFTPCLICFSHPSSNVQMLNIKQFYDRNQKIQTSYLRAVFSNSFVSKSNKNLGLSSTHFFTNLFIFWILVLRIRSLFSDTWKRNNKRQIKNSNSSTQSKIRFPWYLSLVDICVFPSTHIHHFLQYLGLASCLHIQSYPHWLQWS